MGQEINLLKNYPQSKRGIFERSEAKTEHHREIGRKFGKDYFDGERDYGYGGYSYHPRFWEPVIPTFKDYYSLTKNDKVLDIGCGKGFMLYDLWRLIPDIELRGIDISQYAYDNSMERVKSLIDVGNAKNLPYDDNSFDLVISINTIHNLEINDCMQALKEIERVSKGQSFLTVDAYRNDEEKERMEAWNLTALTYLHVDEWINLFNEVGYTGDYYWFIP